MRPLNILAAWVFVTVTWLSAGNAHAARGVVTIDLKPATGEVPTHMCVVSESPGARTREQLWSYLESSPAGPAADGAQRWRLLPRAWEGSKHKPPASCASDPRADCRAEVVLPTGMAKDAPLYTACTADTLYSDSSTADPRVLVLMLEHLDASPPDIDSVRLTGGIATIGVGSFVDRAVVTARSLGGHYLPHSRNQQESSGEPGS